MTRSDTPAASGKASVTSTPEAITVTRTFDAPRALVFKAWTEPEQLRQWWGPHGYTTPAVTVDLRPGGLFRYCMRSPEGREFWGRGRFREVVPPERLVYVDAFTDERGNVVDPTHYGLSPAHPRESLVTVTFAERGGRTTVTLRHEMPEATPERAGAGEGWSEMLERLAALVAPQSEVP